MQPKTQCCGNCRFRQPIPNSPAYLCRRYPPRFVVDLDREVEYYSSFPPVTIEMWCGDWMPDNDTTAHLPAPYA